jgi:hypothetical protein
MDSAAYRQYVKWVASMWELHEAENLMFVYTVLRRR